jgi:prolyl-tRNA synthetase
MPLGLRVKEKIERIIREEMAAAGAHEVHFPALLPREPYEATGRWEEYGDALFRLKDRHGADYLLAPTHEEVFTLMVKDIVSSYKDLPLSLYQIQDKYRDEARPRAGLLRGREFTMKDAYSFDWNDEGLEASYQAQRDAYERIFRRLGLDYVIVAADSGAMGGSKSEEFLHPTEIGEDTFVRTADGSYAANVEAYTATPAEPRDASGDPAVEVFDTPNAGTIDAICEMENITGDATLKNLVVALTDHEGKRELAIVGLQGDRAVDMKRLEIAFAPREVEAATEDDLKAHPELIRGYIGPWKDGEQFLGEESITGIPYFLDTRIGDGSTWVTGANVNEQHVRHLVFGRDFVADGRVEAAEVRDGDPAPGGLGPITAERGTEIGHVFQLGRKYAEALGAKVLDPNGKQVVVTMGSYGIGVTRNLALVAEQNHDDRGLIWPEELAPFDVHVIATGKGEVPLQVATQLAEGAEAEGLEVLFDDRPKESPGVKFGDAELIGIPWILIAGKTAADGIVELWNRRSNERTQVSIDEAIPALLAARAVR